MSEEKQYPKSDQFSPEHQPYPGLETKMSPRPISNLSKYKAADKLLRMERPSSLLSSASRRSPSPKRRLGLPQHLRQLRRPRRPHQLLPSPHGCLLRQRRKSTAPSRKLLCRLDNQRHRRPLQRRTRQLELVKAKLR